VPFVADDLGAWLVGALADAGRRKLTTLILGSEQDRALRRAATAAVGEVAADVRPYDAAGADDLARIISQVFNELLPTSAGSRATLLEDLRAGIAGQLAVLDDPSQTGTDVSSAALLGVSGADLADLLTARLTSEIIRDGAHGGPLAPLADQLNHDVTHLQGQRIEAELSRLVALLAGSLPAGGQAPGASAGEISAVASAYRDESRGADRKLRYEDQRDTGRLVVRPRDPYLDVLRAGGPLTVHDYWNSLWEDTFSWPTLDVKVVNNSARTVFFDRARFQVSESRPDLRPVPVIHGVEYVTNRVYLPLVNSGWGPLEDCVFRFRLTRGDEPVPCTGEYSQPLSSSGGLVDEEPFIAALREGGWGVAPPPADPDDYSYRRFSGPAAVASGVLEYSQTELDGSRSRRANPVTMRFVFGESPLGAPMPPSWTYQVKLRPDGRDYTVTVPVSQVLAAGEADRFLFKVAADRSSLHQFDLILGYLGGELEPVPVTLELFVPVEYEWIKRWMSEADDQ
jgi:hypothetical protein